VLPIEDSRTETLLQDFVRLGVNISHQKTEIPLGRQRDSNDFTGLSKARLVLDTLTLKALNQLVEKLELAADSVPNQAQIARLQESLTALRDNRYGGNPVKQYTDMGFTHHQTLEATYDSIKAYMKAFRKKDHGVSTTMRTLMKTRNQNELQQKLNEVILSLRKGESLSFGRKYGAATNLKFMFNAILTPSLFLGSKVGSDRTYDLSFSRTDKGIQVSFGRSFATSLNTFFEVGYDLLPDVFGKLTNDLDNNREMRLIFRVLKGQLDLTRQNTTQNGLSFTIISEEELSLFVNDMFQNSLNPLEIFKKGMGNGVKESSKTTFDVDLSVGSEFRLETDINGGENQYSFMRISAGVNSQANLMNTTKEHSVTRDKDSTKNVASHNRPRFLNKASAGASLGSNFLKAASTDGGNFRGEDKVRELSVEISVDDRTSTKSEMRFKRHLQLKKDGLARIFEQLREHFTCPLSGAALQTFSQFEAPEEQLDALYHFFSKYTPENEGQFSALNQLHDAAVKQWAAKRNIRLPGELTYSTSYTKLSHLNQDSMLDTIVSNLSPKSQPTISQQIKHIMTNDKELDTLIKSLQKNRNCKANVVMELKDEVKKRAELELLNGTMLPQDAVALLKHPENVRIKSIGVTQIVGKSEGFSIPFLVTGSSSASLAMEKTMGKVTFNYGRDQNKPLAYSTEGEVSMQGTERFH